MVVFILVVGSLIRLSLLQAYERANVVFLLDMSHSIATTARQHALDFLRAVVEHKRPQDQVGLVVFGADALLDQAVSADFTLRDISTEVDGTYEYCPGDWSEFGKLSCRRAVWCCSVMGMKMSRPRRIRRSLPAHSGRRFSLPLAVLPGSQRYASIISWCRLR